MPLSEKLLRLFGGKTVHLNIIGSTLNSRHLLVIDDSAEYKNAVVTPFFA